jgi:molybdate-binding protein
MMSRAGLHLVFESMDNIKSIVELVKDKLKIINRY